MYVQQCENKSTGRSLYLLYELNHVHVLNKLQW